MNSKPTFFTADLHVGHLKAIEYDNRPFTNLDHMHEVLITRYNATVPKNGICYFLGDMGNKNEEIKKVINQLNGTKVLILGNHDKNTNSMYNCGFDVVMYGATLYINNQKVTLTHCPLFGVFREDTSQMKTPGGNWHGEHKNTRFTTKDEGQFHLSGHIHSSKDKPQSQKILGRQFDVGCVGNGYAPVSIGTIESWIAKTLKEENENSKANG